MPHIIVEYSANIDSDIAPQRVIDAMHAAAVVSGIAEVAGFRTRGERRDVYRIGDGGAANAFVHVTARIRDGRTVEQRKALAQRLMDAANAVLEPVFAARPMALSVEVQELDAETRLMRNTMRSPAKDDKAA